ncbi:MAG: hypothetical protein EHM42_10545 [Planctomycetaceae bacterium]|nr:MAG: hypothetical protein EHM42_10545 [Planctomycetaceae bacterium]
MSFRETGLQMAVGLQSGHPALRGVIGANLAEIRRLREVTAARFETLETEWRARLADIQNDLARDPTPAADAASGNTKPLLSIHA